MIDPTAAFEAHRSRLFGIAYGMLGSTADADDILQEAYLRWQGVDHASVDAVGAYLTTVTTRLAIDELRSARRRREAYTGPWLPEPLVAIDDGPEHVVTMAERLSLAMLTAFERLTPIERAVILLREVFDLDYAEIADIVDASPANCRQIASRARDRVGDATRARTPAPDAEQLITAYLEAISAGDVDGVAAVFAQDVVLWADGGGKVRAAVHPLHGALRVARHLVGVAPQAPPGTSVRIGTANGDIALVATHDGQCIAVIAFEVADGRVSAVRAILNPDKLGRVAA